MPVINKLDRLSRALQDLGIDSDSKTTQQQGDAPSTNGATSADELVRDAPPTSLSAGALRQGSGDEPVGATYSAQDVLLTLMRGWTPPIPGHACCAAHSQGRMRSGSISSLSEQVGLLDIEPCGRTAFVRGKYGIGCHETGIFSCRVEPNGELVKVDQKEIESSSHDHAWVFDRVAPAITADEKTAIVASRDDVFSFRIEEDGSLTALSAREAGPRQERPDATILGSTVLHAGRKLLYWNEIDAQGRLGETQELELGFEVMGAPSVSPDGRTAILCGRGSNSEGVICTIQCGKGNELEKVSELINPAGTEYGWFWSGVAVSPDGKTVVAQDLDGVLLSFDLTPAGQLTVKGSMEGLYSGISSPAHCPVLSPDGRTAFVVLKDRKTIAAVRIEDDGSLRKAGELELEDGCQDFDGDPILTEDGARMVVGTKNLLFLVSIENDGDKCRLNITHDLVLRPIVDDEVRPHFITDDGVLVCERYNGSSSRPNALVSFR